MEIYLDHAATTYVDERVLEAMKPYFSEEYGNPGSFNSEGFNAKKAVDSARQRIAGILGCSAEEIIFTGSGTESINLALHGFVKALAKKEGHIITSKIEHPSVLETCRFLESKGFDVTYLDVDERGLVAASDVEKAITKKTVLLSIMYANNEIGTIQPIKEIASVAKKHKIAFHTDACQAAGSLDINVKNLGVDMMTLNASKVYGPKGIGLLYVRKGVKIKPLIYGGGQEQGYRSGTENVPAIIGFAKALEIAEKGKQEENKRLSALRDRLINGILKNIPRARLNGDVAKRLPNNVNISFKGIESEALLLRLDDEGIYASAGSACTSGKIEPSHVLKAIGLSEEDMYGAIRFSLGKRNDGKQIDKVLEVLLHTVKELRGSSKR